MTTPAHAAILGSKRIHRFGHLPDPPHKRTQRSSRTLLGAAPSLPKSASLAHFAAPVMDQGSTGSCYGHGCSQLNMIAFGSAGISLPWVPSQVTCYQLARIVARASGAIRLQDVGSYPADGAAAQSQWGVCGMIVDKTPDGRFSDCWGPDDLTGMPTVSPNVNSEPSFLALESAGLKLIAGEYRIDETSSDVVSQVCASIAQGFPVGIGCFVDTGFEEWTPAKGPLDRVNLADTNGGGHWICLDGYDLSSTKAVFTILNSWSSGWGDQGRIRVTENWLRAAVSDLYPWKVQVAVA